MTGRRFWLAAGAAWDLARFFLVLSLLVVVVRGAGGGRNAMPWLLLASTGNLLVPVGVLVYLLFPGSSAGLLGLLRLGKALELAAFVLLATSGRLLADARLEAVTLGKREVPVWLAAGIFAVLDAVFLVILLREKAAAAAPARAARGLQEMGEPR